MKKNILKKNDKEEMNISIFNNNLDNIKILIENNNFNLKNYVSIFFFLFIF
jgi:hypothetical protein